MLNYTPIFRFLIMLKFYHWECSGKPEAIKLHEALDEAFNDYRKAIDPFVENTIAWLKPDRHLGNIPGMNLPSSIEEMGSSIVFEAEALRGELKDMCEGDDVLESLYQNIGAILGTLIYRVPQCMPEN